MPSDDAAWGKLSPGRLLLDGLVEWSFLQGLRNFDFTIGDEPYKFVFSNVHEAFYGRLDPRFPLGWAYWLKATLDERRSQAGRFETDRRLHLRRGFNRGAASFSMGSSDKPAASIVTVIDYKAGGNEAWTDLRLTLEGLARQDYRESRRVPARRG